MSIKIVKGNYSSVMDSASLTGNRTITLPNSTGTVALTNQLSKVATSNNYNDLSNRPALKTVATSGSYNDLSNKPTLAKVATSGSYNDLSNKPSIPASMAGYVTVKSTSGTSGYRKWSDGYVEQWCRHNTSGSVQRNVTLPTAMSNTNYNVITSAYGSNEYGYNSCVGCTPQSTTQVKIKCDSGAPLTNFFYVCGY